MSVDSRSNISRAACRASSLASARSASSVRACAFVAKPDGRNRTPLHELEKNEVLTAWKATKQAADQAIGPIRSELGLVNMNILWSGALLVPIIALCATQSPRKRDSKGLVAWLALGALLHRYSGSSESALDQDLKACRENDPIGALLKNLRQGRSALVCWRFTLPACTEGDVDRHHILRRAQFPESSRATADNIANIAFIVGDVNKSIGQTGPEVYLPSVGPRVLESQCIPIDNGLWAINRADDFWAARRELLAESFNEFLRESLPERRLGSG